MVASFGEALDIGCNVIEDFKGDVHAMDKAQQLLQEPTLKAKRNLEKCERATYMQVNHKSVEPGAGFEYHVVLGTQVQV